jgi:endo-1,4-beta-xylanase
MGDATRARRAGIALVCAVLAVACSSRDEPGASNTSAPAESTAATTTSTSSTTTTTRPTTTTTRPGAQCIEAPASCTLAQASLVHDVRIGAALGTAQIDRPELASLVAGEFTQITPENELKWSETEPIPGEFRFDRADRLVDYAEASGLEIRGHTLIWGQSIGNGTPGWVGDIADAEQMRAEMERYITTVVGRYRGRIQRWDVVNEPLDNPGTQLDDNRFLQLLGPEYIDLAFTLAAEADPDAELWLNEIDAELSVERGAALVALVADLKSRGVPIDGVGLQGHLVSGDAPPAGQMEGLITALRALDVEVAITELDIPIVVNSGDQFGRQAFAYRGVVGECIRAGCSEITLWGVSDADSWLNNQLGRDAQPLLFDAVLNRKPAYDGVRDTLAAP